VSYFSIYTSIQVIHTSCWKRSRKQDCSCNVIIKSIHRAVIGVWTRYIRCVSISIRDSWHIFGIMIALTKIFVFLIILTYAVMEALGSCDNHILLVHRVTIDYRYTFGPLDPSPKSLSRLNFGGAVRNYYRPCRAGTWAQPLAHGPTRYWLNMSGLFWTVRNCKRPKIQILARNSHRAWNSYQNPKFTWKPEIQNKARNSKHIYHLVDINISSFLI
jgi:hypothetical protein